MKHQLKWLGAVCFAFTALGCEPDPEVAGDPCGGDNCPGDMVCEEAVLDDGDTEEVCHAQPGSPCDRNGTPCGDDDEHTCKDLCAGEALCVDDGDGGGVCARIIQEGGVCDPKSRTDRCADGLVCSPNAEYTEYHCWKPLTVKGMVFDSATTTGIQGAHVIGLDDQKTAASDIAVTDVGGNYLLDVDMPRDATGAPIPDNKFTLRASAKNYQTFPGGIRDALPISTSEAMADAHGWTIQTPVTDIALIALPDAQKGFASISGRVSGSEDRNAGALVVAEGGDGIGYSAVADRSGDYTIFNVPDGSYTVTAYSAFLQVTPANVNVSAKTDVLEVNLAESSEATGTINGNVNIVNAPGGSVTSVVLVVESTFNETFVRGDVPRGLRAPLGPEPTVDGAFMIEGVPAGRYVVLAAFENDLLVRDPDICQGGTELVHTEMPRPGTVVDLETSFKVTEALELVGPGATDPEAVSGMPTFTWVDDSSEIYYTAVVFNAYGEIVWCRSDAEIEGTMCDGGNVMACPGATGPEMCVGANVELPYDGPLDPGMYYQFRITSVRQGDCPISATEDLRGVFFSGG